MGFYPVLMLQWPPQNELEVMGQFHRKAFGIFGLTCLQELEGSSNPILFNKSSSV